MEFYSKDAYIRQKQTEDMIQQYKYETHADSETTSSHLGFW